MAAGKATGATAAGGCGCVVLAVLGLALFMGAIFAYTSIVAQQTWFVPGDASAFDPLASFDAVSAHAGPGTRLLSFEARFVRADGTLDLEASYSPPPTVEYRFARAVSSPQSVPPVGAGRAPGDHWFEPVTVKVSRPWAFRGVSRTSGGVRTRYQYFDLGMARDARDAQSGPEPTWAPRPTCALRDLWKVAMDQGAPKEAVAVIRYDAGGYRFTIEGTHVDLAFAPDCALRNVRR